MTVLYRAGSLPSKVDLENSNAVWFDSHSQFWLQQQGHIPRADSVFMALREEDALFWAERRYIAGHDYAVWEVTIPDSVELYAYEYRFYDEAHRAVGVWGDGDYQSRVNSYWISSVTVDYFWEMYCRNMEGYDYPEEWEVKVPLAVASSAYWEKLYEFTPREYDAELFAEMREEALQHKTVPLN